MRKEEILKTGDGEMTEKIYQKVKAAMEAWEAEEGIYAVSFFVESNECYAYRGFRNVSVFAVSYNTEADCQGAGPYDEERWNYAFWRQNETWIIDHDRPDELTDALFDWYAQQGLTNLGDEDEDCYDENFCYIGKGPVGHYALLDLAAQAARRLQQEGFLEKKLGRKLPIIVHGLEYAWFDLEATEKANPNGEAAEFLQAMEEMGFV